MKWLEAVLLAVAAVAGLLGGTAWLVWVVVCHTLIALVCGLSLAMGLVLFALSSYFYERLGGRL